MKASHRPFLLVALFSLPLATGVACDPSVTPEPNGPVLEPDGDAWRTPSPDDEEDAADAEDDVASEGDNGDVTDPGGEDDVGDPGSDEGEDDPAPDDDVVNDDCSPDGWCREAPSLDDDIPDDVRFRGVHAFSADDVWAVGDGGVIAHRDADGWSLVESGTGHDIFAVWGAGDDDVWAVGGQGWPTDPNGLLMHYDGESWTVATDTAPATLRAVWGSAADDVWAAGAGLLMHYDGVAWSVSEDSPTWDVSDVWGAAADDVWIVGSDGMTARFDGDAWTEVPTGQLAGLTAVHGMSADDVFLLGGNGLLFRLQEGAWLELGAYESETYFALWVSGVKGAVAVGTNAAIRRYYGDAFIAEDAGTTVFLMDVMGLDDERAFAVGCGGTLLRRDP